MADHPWPNGSSFRDWQSRNCDKCARMDWEAHDAGDAHCGCDIEAAIAQNMFDVKIPEAIQERMKWDGGGYMSNQCGEFIPEGEPVPPPEDPNQMKLEL